MEMNRRSFFKGMLAVTAVAAVGLPVLASPRHGELVFSHWAGPPPVLYGDGIHDDTAALNALFAGEMVRIEGEDIVAQDAELIGGTYLISDTITFRTNSRMTGTTIVLTENFRGANMIDAVAGTTSHITGVHFIKKHSPGVPVIEPRVVKISSADWFVLPSGDSDFAPTADV